MENMLTTTLRRAKSFLILALVALAIYQTGRLWFVHMANRNFFLYVTARFVPSVPERSREFVRPMRVIRGAGDGQFAIQYDRLMDTSYRVFFDTVMSELLAGGRFVSVADTDYERILSHPVLIFEYAFAMPGDVFPLGFDSRATTFLTTRGLQEFNSVAIWPSVEGSNVSVFFTSEGRTWEFVLDGVRENLGPNILPVSASSIHFVSAALEGYECLPPGTFVARSGDIGFSYFPVTVSNPYRRLGMINSSHIRNQVAHFFDNPATINARIAGDGVLTFSNIHTVVRYFATDVLEYANFRPRHQNVVTTFLDDFSAAWAFVAGDPHVADENEIFLTGFEARGSGYVFWFGYIVDNFPILMPDNWEVSSPDDILPAPIEVLIDRGRVVRYRRLAHNFSIGDSHVWLGLDLEGFLESQERPLAGLRLGYLMNSGESRLRLGLHGLYAEVNQPEYEYDVEYDD